MNLQGEFYFVENNVPVGPFSLDELLTKNITKKTYIWTNGMENWQRIESLPEVLEKFNFGKVQPQTSDRSINIESISYGESNNKHIFRYLYIGLSVFLAFIGGYFFNDSYGEIISSSFEEIKISNFFNLKDHNIAQIKEISPNIKLYAIKDRKTGCIGYGSSRDFKIVWNGTCVNGTYNGFGKLKIFSKKNVLLAVSTCTMLNGIRNGDFVDTIISEKKIVTGKRLNGIYNGLITERFFDGVLTEANYINGKLEGKRTITYKRCDTCKVYNTKEEYIYKNDKLISKDNHLIYRSDGMLTIMTLPIDEENPLNRNQSKNLKIPTKFILPDGSSVSGIFSIANSTWIGEVTIEYPNGNKRIAPLINNATNGYGHEYFKNGDVYSGYFVNGKKEGEGKFAMGRFLFTGKFKNDNIISGVLKDTINNKSIPYTITNSGLSFNDPDKYVSNTFPKNENNEPKNVKPIGPQILRLGEAAVCDDFPSYMDQTVQIRGFYAASQSQNQGWSLRRRNDFNEEQINSSLTFQFYSDNDKYYTRVIYVGACPIVLRIPRDLSSVPNIISDNTTVTGVVIGTFSLRVTQISR